ncbi:hypothetical protein, partial [uncultured Senegalimassilia sp.]|uniref:hypothetical protein n=1 Tax=uncultured Senegalimassilia sp. TaxID=1714350 RepID=UPI0026DFE2FA
DIKSLPFLVSKKWEAVQKRIAHAGVFLPEGDSGPQLPEPVRLIRPHLDLRDGNMTAKTALGEVSSRAVLRVCIVFSQFKVLCLLA